MPNTSLGIRDMLDGSGDGGRRHANRFGRMGKGELGKNVGIGRLRFAHVLEHLIWLRPFRGDTVPRHLSPPDGTSPSGGDDP
jgi:hypothetical protein